MRSDARVVACLLIALAALAPGCRKTLTPEPAATQAPETWLTDATVDTLPPGAPVAAATATAGSTIRYHLSWAGTSRAGTVAGFRLALVEETGNATNPSARDWRFTTATETTLVFPLAEAARPRAFYVAAVGLQGAADATPARLALVPGALVAGVTPTLDAEAIGTIVTLDRRGEPVLHRNQRFPLHAYVPGAALDTVPMGSTLRLRWRPAAGSGAPVETTLTQAGVQQLTLRPPGGGSPVTLRFVVDFAPDTWWAGPDPSLWPLSTDGEGARAVDVTNWSTFTTSVAWPPDGRPYFGPDSLGYLPSMRQPPGGNLQRRTFYEIYKNRIYARAEGDTVHLNSWIALMNGGYDKDSYYQPLVQPEDPALPADFASNPARYPVLQDLGLVGSPIGFRSVFAERLAPAGPKSYAPQSSVYPAWLPSSVFRSPRLAGYWAMREVGKVYAVGRAVDSENLLDAQVTDPITLADNVDAGGGTPAERAARRKVLVFYVDKAPALVRDAAFYPKEGQTFNTTMMSFTLRGMDLDPVAEGIPTGGPAATQVIRFKVTLYGKGLAGNDTSWTWQGPGGSPYLVTSGSGTILFTPGGSMAANPFASGIITVSIQVCDCAECVAGLSGGRCVEGIDPGTGQVVTPANVIHVNYVRPAI